MANNNNISEFVLNWNMRVPQIFENYLFNSSKNRLPTRNLFNTLVKKIDDFFNNGLIELDKINIITGIRGVGKTTLLLQLLNFESYIDIKKSYIFDKVFIDVGRLVNEGYTLNDFFKYYEEEKGIIFENNKNKIIFALDEIHYDKNWGLTLKNIFDSSKGNNNILIFVTGSSSLKIRINPDLARRANFIELYPLQFPEYIQMKYNIKPDKKLSNDISNSLINSSNADELYKILKSEEKKVNEIKAMFPLYSKDKFFLYGGFPVNLNIEQRAFDNIKNIIDIIILKDVISIKEYNLNVTSQINTLIYLLSISDVISIERIKKSINISDNRTLYGVLDSIEKSGIITKVKSYGGAYSSARKAPKYLFNSPSLRCSILDGIIPTGLEGKKLEDYFILLYSSVFKKFGVRDINYDASKGGADFILKNLDNSMIITEVGFNKNKPTQIKRTNNKVNAKYGMLIGSDKIELEDNFIVKVPLEYLMLI